ncbi:MAG TPA: beta-propeller fold lactonase family protein [Terriglobia bacterium]|jgi:YVTN family beta-propeller protein
MTFQRVMVMVLACLSLPLSGLAQVRIVQTNSGGDNIHLIDPATNKVVGEVKGVPVNHGAAASPDGRTLYFSSEAERTLDVVNGKTLTITKKIALSGRPNNITASKDGKRVYVAIVSEPGAIDVIDAAKQEKIKTIPAMGGVHNVYLTPDGKYLVSGSIASGMMSVFDSRTDELAWTLKTEGVRPIVFETDSDGSTKRAFVQVSGFHGFVAVDFAGHKEMARIKLPDIPVEERAKGTFQGAPSHGMGVTPDGKTLWVTSRMNRRVYAYSLPDLKLLAEVPVGNDPDWITMTPDGKMVYVANAESNSVSAIDTVARKEVARIPVGENPKRNITVVMK